MNRFSFLPAVFLSLLAMSARAEVTVVHSVEATEVQYIETSRHINISALLANKTTQKLSFKVGGLVAEVMVDDGDTVEKGQVLARLDTEEVSARVSEAKARFDNAQRNVERLKKLYEKNVASLDQLQDAETVRDVTVTQLRVAKFNLKHSEIKAPGAGKVIRKAIEASEFVSPNQMAFLLSDKSDGWIMRTGLSDRNVVLVKNGDPVTVRFDPWPLQKFQGRISNISEAAEDRSGLFEVEIALEPTDKHLREGFIGRIHIEPALTRKVILLPTLSLVSAVSPSGVVYVIGKDRVVSPRKVHVHYLEGSKIAVSGELENGERVVTTGAEFLKDGDKVRVLGITKTSTSIHGEE